MKRAAWTHSFAGLPLSKIALAISAKAHATDQRAILVTDSLEVLVILFLVSNLITLRTGPKEYTPHFAITPTVKRSSQIERNVG